MQKGTIRILYGPGRGKSAAAMGYGVLGAAKKQKVIMVQFLKGILDEGTMEMLKRIEPEMKVFRFERSLGLFESLPDEKKKEELINLKNGFHFAKKVLATGECGLLILDEILGLIDQNVVTLEEFLELLKSRHEETDLVMTGRVCPREIRALADSISFVEKTEDN